MLYLKIAMTDTIKNSILIVDDDKLDLEILNNILSDEYIIYLTKSGASAVDLAAKYEPDLILLDIIMPDINGFEVLASLKKSPKTHDIPVIFITGLDSVEDEEKGLGLDAADFIQKPFSGNIVKLRVRNQLQIINQIRAIKKYAHEVAASEERTRFFARMSHEMRTPLNAVIGLSEMTLAEGGLSSEAQENIEKISSSGESLLGLVNDILDISKIESGMFKLAPVEYDTSFVISDAISQNILRKGEKPIKFIVNIDENLPSRLFGDDLRIKQVLNNLLSNAFKYTREGTVEMRVKSEPSLTMQDHQVVTVSIKDTGIGIKEEDLETLFSDYMQANSKTNKYSEGTGLGLPITKMMTEMMGGKITVESEYEKGTTFTVNFLQKLIDSEPIGADVIARIRDFQYTGKRNRQPLKERIILPYARILVVDDVIYNLDVAKGMMKPYRMMLDCVTSGQEAVDAIRDEKVKYNAVFMDHMMPVMDGIEAVRIIREEIGTEYAKTIPIIAFTANAIAGNEEMFLSKGFQAFISKPVDIHRLDAIIRQWVRDEEQEKLIDMSEFDKRSGKDRRRENELGDIEGVNFNKGLERFGGNMDTFLDILQSFTSNTRQLLEIIKDVNRENLNDYAIHVHGVKSSCRGIGAEALGTRAEALEKAAKAGNLEFVIANNRIFIEDVHNLIDKIEAILNKDKTQSEKPKKDKPYKEALIKLKMACEKYQIEEIDLTMLEIECFDYTDDDGLALWLRENAGQMN
jgi:signal transduction histidine kinase/HPt (histidine-containing phosphotransfer) domain-containing protein